MAVTDKTSSSPGSAPLLPSRTSSSPLSLRAHRLAAADFKFKQSPSPAAARGHCPLQGLGHNDTLPSAARRQASPPAASGSPVRDEEQDSFPNFIRSKTEEYSKRIRKLQDDYLYPLKEDLAEWINRVLQTNDLSAENFIEKLDNGVLILRMAKIIESQCNIFEDSSSSSSNHSRNTSTTNGNSGNNVNNIVQSNGVGRVKPGKGSHHQESDSSSNSHNGNGCNRLDNDQSDCSSPPTPTPRPRRCHRVLQSSQSVTTSSSSPTSSLSPSSSPVSRSFSPFSKSHPLSPFSSSSGQMLIHGKLAHLNQNRQQQFNNHTSANSCNTPFKICSIKAWENAKSQSFYARDNVCNFIKWCRFLKVREAVIFESEDLVLHNNQRNVILCLLEVARIVCTKYGFVHVPGLVQLEKEIDQEIEREEQAKQLGNNCNHGNDCHHYQDVAGDAIDPGSKPQLRDSHTEPLPSAKLLCDMQTTTESLHTGKHLVDNWSSTDCGRSPSPAASSISMTSAGVSEIASTPDPIPRSRQHADQSMGSTASSSSQSSDPRIKASQLDQKVMLIAKSFYGKKHNRIQRLEEGKYRISGKIVFVRLLRDRHVMVRVGGGWDTLPHFLERHGLEEDISAVDISPSDLLPMDTRPSETKRRDYNSPLMNKSLSTILFKSPSVSSNGFASAAQLTAPLSPSLSQMPQALDMGSSPATCITSPSKLSKSSSASSHSQLARSLSTNSHATAKPQRLNWNTGSRSSIPTTPGSSLRSPAAAPMYRSPSASSIPILLRRCSSSAPLNRRTPSRQVN